MIGGDEDGTKRVLPASQSDTDEDLPFRIELWTATTQQSIERVLARAHSPALARAIFKAAVSEHPERRITLSHSRKLIADSAN